MTNPNGSGLMRWVARAGAILVVAAPLSVFAQTLQPPLPPPATEPPGALQPVEPPLPPETSEQPDALQTLEPPQPRQNGAEPAPASAGAGWTTESDPGETADPNLPVDARPPIVLSTEQRALLGQINEYLNGLINLRGRFVQTDYRNEEKHGLFYVRRPGRLRFDYASPSKLRVVSDGQYLSVEDHDLKTVDKYPLKSTPIQLVLGEDVNLVRDTVILDMRQDDSAVVIIIKDKSGDSAGYLQLFFRRPELELYEWVITDAQGLDTRIQLADLVTGDEQPDDFFKSTPLELENMDNN